MMAAPIIEVTPALARVLEASRGYFRSGGGDAPDVHGIAPRTWYGQELRRAAEAWAREEAAEGTAER
jgi:hypothetical protein